MILVEHQQEHYIVHKYMVSSNRRPRCSYSGTQLVAKLLDQLQTHKLGVFFSNSFSIAHSALRLAIVCHWTPVWDFPKSTKVIVYQSCPSIVAIRSFCNTNLLWMLKT